MQVATVTQQPSEKYSYTVNYAPSLPDGDSIKSVALASVTPAGLTVSNLAHYSPRVKLWVEGGVSGITYKVQFNVESNHGARFQDELLVKVKEV